MKIRRAEEVWALEWRKVFTKRQPMVSGVLRPVLNSKLFLQELGKVRQPAEFYIIYKGGFARLPGPHYSDYGILLKKCPGIVGELPMDLHAN